MPPRTHPNAARPASRIGAGAAGLPRAPHPTRQPDTATRHGNPARQPGNPATRQRDRGPHTARLDPRVDAPWVTRPATSPASLITCRRLPERSSQREHPAATVNPPSSAASSVGERALGRRRDLHCAPAARPASLPIVPEAREYDDWTSRADYVRADLMPARDRIERFDSLDGVFPPRSTPQRRSPSGCFAKQGGVADRALLKRTLLNSAQPSRSSSSTADIMMPPAAITTSSAPEMRSMARRNTGFRILPASR